MAKLLLKHTSWQLIIAGPFTPPHHSRILLFGALPAAPSPAGTAFLPLPLNFFASGLGRTPSLLRTCSVTSICLDNRLNPLFGAKYLPSKHHYELFTYLRKEQPKHIRPFAAAVSPCALVHQTNGTKSTISFTSPRSRQALRQT